uniref:Transcription factor CBF/NF-Y/archaeal histone domain-containing protein n=1 Tax=Salix viminalis TaxID=40686 RepID=A0A6N2KFY3_SALVM
MVDNGGAGASGDDGGVKLEQDRLKFCRRTRKSPKEAKETIQECASEFISFVTGEASEKCRTERRKTVNGDDVCWAMEALGFDDYAGPLRRYLQRYREMEGDRANQEKHANTDNISNIADQEKDASVPCSSSSYRNNRGTRM